MLCGQEDVPCKLPRQVSAIAVSQPEPRSSFNTDIDFDENADLPRTTNKDAIYV